jgi:hypothetical protein
MMKKAKTWARARMKRKMEKMEMRMTMRRK